MGKVPPEEIRVRAEIVLWTALFVLCTLLINAPLLPKVLRLTKLDVIPDARLALRRRALRALDAHTASAVAGLRSEEDAMMAGVDWARVRELTKVGGASDFASFAEQAGGGGRSKESEEKARRRKHLKSLGAFEMRHGVSDAWEGLSRLCRVSAAAVARFFGLGGGARNREEDVSFGAAADATHHLDPRRQKSASSMATIFLDEAGAVAKHYRVFGRTISMSHSGASSPVATVAAAAAAEASRVNLSAAAATSRAASSVSTAREARKPPQMEVGLFTRSFASPGGGPTTSAAAEGAEASSRPTGAAAEEQEETSSSAEALLPPKMVMTNPTERTPTGKRPTSPSREVASPFCLARGSSLRRPSCSSSRRTPLRLLLPRQRRPRQRRRRRETRRLPMETAAAAASPRRPRPVPRSALEDKRASPPRLPRRTPRLLPPRASMLLPPSLLLLLLLL